jgi:HK97 family phage portal protein
LPVLRATLDALLGRQARADNLYGWQTVPNTLMGGSGRTIAGPTVTVDNAVQSIAVFRALSLLSGTLASLPLKAFRMVDGSPEPVPSLLLDYPAGRDPISSIPFPGSDPAMVLWEQLYNDLFSWGNAYAVKVPSVVRTDIVRLERLVPWRVDPKLVKPTKAGLGGPAGKVFGVLDDDGHEQLAGPTDVMHVRGFGSSMERGLSPIGCARQALGLAVAAEEYGARLFGSGSLLGGVLQTDADLDEDDAKELKERWQAKVAGLAHAHEIAVLDNGAKYVPTSLPPNDAQFIESRKFGVTEVARLYGVPPHLLGDVEVSSSWGTGIEQQTLAFVAYTLRVPATRMEQVVSNELLPRGQLARIDFTDLLRGDAPSRFDAYSKAISGSILTVNEARALEGRPPVPGGDKLLMQGAMIPFSTVKAPTPTVKPAPPKPPAGSEPEPPAAGAT